MNRVTVIFLALAILLAHTLAIHQTSDGVFAPPYEIAHVAFRVARNLVHHGTALWDPTGPSIESYPSPLWIGVCTVAERTYVSPILATQCLGIGCALLSVVVLAQFTTKRMSGLVAPTLLAASGSAAAAAASGTEAPVAMLLATGAFLAFERRWKIPLTALLTALVLTRPEGTALIVTLAALELLDRPTKKNEPGVALRGAFVLPLAAVLGLAVVRRVLTGGFLSPFEAQLASIDVERWTLGTRYVASFFLASGSGFLAVLPLVLLLTRKLSGTARRGLVVVAAWSLVVLLSGGDGLPFWNALAPVLPLLFLSIQQAIAGAMDWRPRLAPIMWTLLGVAAAASFVVSKSPGNLGPIPLESIQGVIMKPHEPLVRAYGRPLGREGLEMEIRQVERLRGVGLFLRDKIKHPASIMTFWPGAIGYLSRADVIDFLGRAHPAGGDRRANSWRGQPLVDLVGALEQRPDYVVPITESLSEGATPLAFLREWLRSFEDVEDEEHRMVELLEALARYEMVSVPIQREGGSAQASPFLVLRRKALELSPQLELTLEGRHFSVLLQHHGHHQVVDLMISLVDREGEQWTMRPTGEFLHEVRVDARTNVLLYATGTRPVHMLRGTLPAGVGAGRLTARLHNPGTRSAAALATVGSAVSREFE